MMEWISVNDRLPEFDGEYLTYDENRNDCSVQYFDMNVWGYLCSIHAIVTHWMPLPDPPKQ